MKICISGGHLTPALALIEHITEKHVDDSVIFVGRVFSKQNKEQLSREKEEVTRLGGTFIPFDAPKIKDTGFVATLTILPSMLVATCKAIILMVKYSPDLFVSFGGYLALPLAFAAWILRIPILTHEQTRSAGVANILIAKIARIVALSYTESSSYFPSSKSFIVGNPIRQNILKENMEKPSWLNETDSPILYITGGSQGSEIINRTVLQCLQQLTKDWCVIHQCGSATTQSNYKKELDAYRKTLSKQLQSRYYVREWLTDQELGYVYSTTKGVVARSGANTVEEIRLRAVPALFIPLPFSHNDEQYKNAQALVLKEEAIILEQKNLTPETLIKKIQELKSSAKKIVLKLAKENQQREQDPAAAIYALMQKAIK